MSARRFLVCAILVFSFANGANAARYQRCKDGKTLVWNSQRGVAQEAAWSGLRDMDGYATGEGTLTWYRLAEVVNSYTGKMVRGKFEGPVVKEQAGTRLQATFANGEKVSGWSAPGAEERRTPTATPTPAPKQESPTPSPTMPPPDEADILPTPIPARSPTTRARSTSTPTTPFPTPITTPTPTPVPTRTATATPSPTPAPSPSPTPLQTPSPSQTPTSTITPAPTAAGAGPKTSRLEEIPDGQLRGPLALGSPAPSLRSALEEVPPLEAGASSQASAAPQPAESKEQMIARFKKQTASVLDEVRKATDNFHEIDRIETAAKLPEAISANIASLAEQATALRAKHGYAAAFYDCGAETATTDGLFTLDQTLRDLTEKNAPSGRQRAMSFFKRYPSPTRDNQKPLWRYLISISTTTSKAKARAEEYLKRAKDFEAAGKKSEALREYQEIYRVYPNPIVADKIKDLQQKSR